MSISVQNQFRIVQDGDDPRKGRINLGLCCINNTLRKDGIFCSRTMIQRNYTPEKAQTLALNNIDDLIPVLNWNNDHNIFSYRMSSNMFPHFTNPSVDPYTLSFAKEKLEYTGKIMDLYGHRISMHPGQYNQIGAKSSEVLEKTYNDLKMHADILDTLGLDDNAIVNIHGGGVYGDKEGTKRRWIEQFDDLPSNVKRRLTIENCEKCYSTRDCIEIAEETGIPVVFDTHHYDCYSILHPNETQESPEDLIPEIIDTWKGRKLLFHISEQKEGARVGAHSDFIKSIPEYLLAIPLEYDKDIWIDVEAKAKEAAIMSLHKKYKHLFF